MGRSSKRERFVLEAVSQGRAAGGRLAAFELLWQAEAAKFLIKV